MGKRDVEEIKSITKYGAYARQKTWFIIASILILVILSFLAFLTYETRQDYIYASRFTDNGDRALSRLITLSDIRLVVNYAIVLLLVYVTAWALGQRLYYYRRYKFIETMATIYSKKKRSIRDLIKDMDKLEEEWREGNGA